MLHPIMWLESRGLQTTYADFLPGNDQASAKYIEDITRRREDINFFEWYTIFYERAQEAGVSNKFYTLPVKEVI